MLLVILIPFIYFIFVDSGVQTESNENQGEQVYKRSRVKVEISETLDGKNTEINISDLIIRRTLALHGFELVDEGAEYLVTGELKCDYFQALTFDFQGSSQHLEHQYYGRFSGLLMDADGKELQDLSFPEPMMNGRTDLALAQKDIRRRAATLIGGRLVGGAVLGKPKIQGLLDALTDPLDGRTWNEIVRELTVSGATAVPYLLDALRDDRPVLLSGSYPGYTDLEEGELKIFHIADLALRDILDKDSFLDPDSTEDYLHRVRTAWLWVWEDMQLIPESLRTRMDQRKSSIPAAQG
ncbi:hypothetical protein CBD41_00525 [bacterium TMED181]|nr:hypothetical protein [Planctomycetota bacterium]OUW47672.1 MAG: hypothetical protein CBD41_00525 [bacterium TMED181]